MVTDNSRGLLLSDHDAKILTGIVQIDVYPQYHTYIPDEQFGAAKHRGADFAAHMSSSFVAMCNAEAWSFLVLFVDLSKAFDMVVRELPSGLRQCDDAIPTLVKLGFSDEEAERVAAELRDNPTLLEQISCNKATEYIFKNTHHNSWLKFGDSDDVIVSNRGG